MIYGLVVATAVVASVGLTTAFKVVQVGPAAPAGLPDCRVAERPARHDDYDDWAATLLDPAHALQPSYRPPDLRMAMVHGQVVELRAVRSRAADRDARCRRARRRDDQGDQLIPLIRRSSGSSCSPVRAWTTWLPGPVTPSTSWARQSTSVDGAEWLAHHAPEFGFVAQLSCLAQPRADLLQPRAVALPLLRPRSGSGNRRLRTQPARVAMGRAGRPAALEGDPRPNRRPCRRRSAPRR